MTPEQQAEAALSSQTQQPTHPWKGSVGLLQCQGWGAGASIQGALEGATPGCHHRGWEHPRHVTHGSHPVKEVGPAPTPTLTGAPFRAGLWVWPDVHGLHVPWAPWGEIGPC